MKTSLIVAADEKNGIGKNGKIPWRLSTDLKHFKYITWGMPVVMGRKTFESLGKPLAGRTNIVMSNSIENAPAGVFLARNMYEVYDYTASLDVNEIMIIGGGEIYKEYFGKADKIYLTRVHAAFDADTFFPEIRGGDLYTLISVNKFEAGDQNDCSFEFQVWEKGTYDEQ